MRNKSQLPKARLDELAVLARQAGVVGEELVGDVFALADPPQPVGRLLRTR